ncbi:hypothetical protein Ccrd_004955 [Cynara cardunculus var. scolymus]|uniref:Uncharacterized protein n=1 Tax=Cynara cardunculus var. scolymus TaxID=59895 RepID=A0A103XLL9_CYNCS|nr:hypothetical protein Ccrd_004955 [Cynara cardunculus var. scolymus]
MAIGSFEMSSFDMFFISSRVFPAILRRIPFNEASRHTFVRSSPLYPSVRRATSSMSTSQNHHDFATAIFISSRALARSNKHRTIRSLSPRHFEAKLAEDTLKNVVPHSVATALASSVFPVPGGPNIRTPFQGLLIP